MYIDQTHVRVCLIIQVHVCPGKVIMSYKWSSSCRDTGTNVSSWSAAIRPSPSPTTDSPADEPLDILTHPETHTLWIEHTPSMIDSFLKVKSFVYQIWKLGSLTLALSTTDYLPNSESLAWGRKFATLALSSLTPVHMTNKTEVWKLSV